MKSLYIVMPAYNEEANIEPIVRDWYPVLDYAGEDSRLVVADSGSTDRTHEILLELQKEFPKLIILSDTEKQHGPKLIAMYQYAIDNNAEFIFQTDSDGQTNPKEFERFNVLSDKYDAIIGIRRKRGDGASRAFVEKVVCIMLFLFFGVKVPDANAPFRLMKSELVEKYISRLPKDYFIPNIMFTTYFAFYRDNVIFREISFKPRQAGVNSINIKKIVSIGIQAIGDFTRFKKEMKKDRKNERKNK